MTPDNPLFGASSTVSICEMGVIAASLTGIAVTNNLTGNGLCVTQRTFNVQTPFQQLGRDRLLFLLSIYKKTRIF